MIMEAITINELAKALQKQIQAGNGDKKILLSSDDEGNEYHEMFFMITSVESLGLKEYQIPVSIDEAVENYVILG